MPREVVLSRPGVYLIRNRVDGKVYVGSSVNISKRWSEHRAKLERGTHHSAHLQRAWKKCGADAFEWLIIEPCDAAARIEREQHWADYFGSYRDTSGYNIRKRVETNHAIVPTRETREKMSAARRGKVNSPEARARISAARIGHEVTTETRAKISATKARRYAEGWRPSFVPPPTPPIAPERVVEVRRLLAEGKTQRVIEALTGVSHSTVCRINLGKTPYGDGHCGSSAGAASGATFDH